MTHLIHFIDLDEMIPELWDNTPVRVCTLTDRQQPERGPVQHMTYIAVRQVQDPAYPPATIVSWAWLVGQAETYMGEQVGDVSIDEVAEVARAMEQDVVTHLNGWSQHTPTEEEPNFRPTLKVRTGVIDLAGRDVMFGVWRKWEEDNYNQEVAEKLAE